jgi:hypothetical protein
LLRFQVYFKVAEEFAFKYETRKVFPDKHNNPIAKENRRKMLIWRTNNDGWPYLFNMGLLLVIMLSYIFTGCAVKHGVYVPLVGMFYDYSYLASLEGGKLGEPLQNVVIEDKEAVIKLYGSLEAAETFESYFPDDIKASPELDKLWQSPFKTLRSDKYIVKTIRHGFRNTKQDKTKIIRWISERYGVPHNFTKKESLKAYWLTYYSSFSPEKEVRDSAVRFGIGLHQGGDVDLIAKRLVQLAMEDEKYTLYAVRVAHNRGNFTDIFLNYLEPYLKDTNPDTQNKALILRKKIIENIKD